MKGQPGCVPLLDCLSDICCGPYVITYLIVSGCIQAAAKPGECLCGLLNLPFDIGEMIWRRTDYYHLRLARKMYPAGYYKPPESRLSRVIPGKWRPKGKTDSTVPWGHTKSPLFKLPIEIRVMIYDLIFGGGCTGIHILLDSSSTSDLPEENRRNGYLTSIKCRCPTSNEKDKIGYPCLWNWRQGSRPSGLSGYDCYGSPMADFGTGMMGLVRTCRFMSTEVLSYIYTHKTLIFNEPDILLTFAAQLHPRNLNSITRLHIGALQAVKGTSFEKKLTPMPRYIRRKYPASACHPSTLRKLGGKKKPTTWGALNVLLEEMKGLRRLKIGLRADEFGGHWKRVICAAMVDGEEEEACIGLQVSERFVLEPLVKLKTQLGTEVEFDVTLGWMPPREDEDWVRGAFEVKRKGCTEHCGRGLGWNCACGVEEDG